MLPSGYSEMVKVEMNQKVEEVTKLVQKKMLSLKIEVIKHFFFCEVV